MTSKNILLISLFFFYSCDQAKIETKPQNNSEILDTLKALYSSKKYEDALFILEQENVNKLSESADLKDLTFYKAEIVNKLGESLMALSLYDSAINLSSDFLRNAKIMDRIGSIHRKNGNFFLAQKSYLAGLDYKLRLPLDSVSSKKNIAKSYELLGLVFYHLVKDSISIEYYLKALENYDEINDNKRLAGLFNNIGLTRVQRATEIRRNPYLFSTNNKIERSHILNEALINFETSLKYKQDIGFSTASISNTLNNMGFCLMELKSFDSALYYLNLAKDLRKSIQYNSGLAFTYNNLGRTYDQLDVLDSSFMYYMKSMNYLDKVNSVDEINLTLTLFRNLSKYYSKLEAFDSAYYYLERFDSLYRKNFNHKSERRIQEYQTFYETEKKEQENLLLMQQNIYKSEQNKNLVITLVSLAIITAIALMLFKQRNKSIKLISQKNQQIYNQEISQLLKDQELKSIDAMLEGQEQERKRMAEDLHDRLGSTLSAAKLFFEASIDESSPQKDTAVGLLDKAITDTREIAHNVLSGVLSKFGLLAALNDLKDTVESANQIHVKISTKQFDGRLDPEQEINLYRIVQEFVSNTLKHAQAHNVSIQIKKEDTRLLINIKDDGLGFNSEEVSVGVGLKNIAARVAKMDGQHTFKSAFDSGTQLQITIPT